MGTPAEVALPAGGDNVFKATKQETYEVHSRVLNLQNRFSRGANVYIHVNVLIMSV